jgi:mRNA-degrading endonuclease RelE of RelBE toxin-antitoxin system
MTEPFQLVVARSASRAIAEDLPEAVAFAVIEFMTTALIDNPHRVGRVLRNELAGLYSARRGDYRVLYRIDEDSRAVIVVHVEHRRRAYRRR